MELAINQLIEFTEDIVSTDETTSGNREPSVERILYFNQENDWFVTIDIFSENSMPVLRPRGELMAAIESGLARTLEKDPYDRLITPENSIPEKHREIRDKAYKKIAAIVESPGITQFISKKRGSLINEAIRKYGCTKKTLYHWLRRYWKAGMRKNGLLPAYKNCGTNNEWRAKEHKKTGRPSFLSKTTGEVRGIIITPDIKRKFERGIKKFYSKQNKPSLRRAYRRTIAKFFHIGYDIKDGVPIPIIPPAETLPSFRQFNYWHEKEYRDIRRENRARFGRLEAEMNHRALLGDSTAMAFGPGSVYQIDATIGDIYLVSALDRTRIIGRPVIYFIIDVFSRYIVGIAVTLEGPSWLGAMLALDNVVCDKVAFCAEHGITITADEWNSQRLSVKLQADRGEIEGHGIEPLVYNLGIQVENTPPYRADFKGIVERAFGKANEKFIHFLPGAAKFERNRRGKRDHRLDAILTLKEFRAIVIQHALDYNAGNYLSSYNPDEYQIADQVDLFPQDLWDWGLKNRSGHLRKIDREVVRLNLLPRKQVSVTRHGIHFEHKLFYTCELAEKEGWFESAGRRGAWKIEVAYDPRSLANIYIPLDEGRDIVTCYLTPAAKTFKSSNIYDIQDYFQSKTERREESRTRELQSDAKSNAVIESITSEAKEKTEAAKRAAGDRSVRSQLAGIRENRKTEREMERESGVFDLTGQNDTLPETAADRVTEVEVEDEEGYVPQPSRISRIKKVIGNK